MFLCAVPAGQATHVGWNARGVLRITVIQGLSCWERIGLSYGLAMSQKMLVDRMVERLRDITWLATNT